MIYRSGSMSSNIVQIIPRQGVAGMGSSIDVYIDSKDDLSRLYERWQTDRWGSPEIVFGGEKLITCEMLLEVPQKDLDKVYGKKLAEKLIEAAHKGA